jgi:hypothetical protein
MNDLRLCMSFAAVAAVGLASQVLGATVRVEILTDNYPSETTWEVTDQNEPPTVYGSGGPYNQQAFLYVTNVDVPDGECINFTIYDAFGDGICCGWGLGEYHIFYDDVEVCSGGEFGSEETCYNLSGDPGCADGPTGCPECPPEGTDEGEPSNGGCEDNYDDVYNAGCNSDPPTWNTPIDCGQTYCGLSGTFLNGGNNYRDTDWFNITLANSSPVTWTCNAEFPLLIFILDVSAGCPAVVVDSATGPLCEEISLFADLFPGTYAMWVGPSVFTGVGCGVSYVATLDCNPPVGACCMPDGSCQEISGDDCDDAQGTYQGDFTSCDDVNCPQPPANNECENAEGIGDVNGKCWDTILATGSQLGTCHFGGPDLFYDYTADENGTVNVEVVNLSLDPAAVAVYQGSGCVGTQIDCENESFGDDLVFTFNGVQGQTYKVQIGGDGPGNRPYGLFSIYSGGIPDPYGACCVDFECVATNTQDECSGMGGDWFEGECCELGFVCSCAGCPQGGIQEDEDCGADANGGCNQATPTPDSFDTVACGDVICGNYWAEGGTRDTDWFYLPLASSEQVTWQLVGDGLDSLIFIIEDPAGLADCGGIVIISSITGSNCQTISLTADLTAGNTYYLWAGTSTFEGTPQCAQYVGEVICGNVPPTACCVDGDCIGDLTPDDCDAAGGFSVAGETCDNFVCPTSLFQPPNQSNGIFSDPDCDFCGGIQLLADNFMLPGETEITSIEFWGGYFPDNLPLSPDVITVIFREDAAGSPGAAIETYGPQDADMRDDTGVDLFGVDEYHYVFNTPSRIVLPAGTYWIELYNDTSANTDSWFWEVGDADPIFGIIGSAFTFTLPEEPWSLDAVNDFALRFNVGGGGQPCPWDLDGNDVVNVFDLLDLLGAYGPCPGCPEDFDGNDIVNVFDLLELLGNWGPCP